MEVKTFYRYLTDDGATATTSFSINGGQSVEMLYLYTSNINGFLHDKINDIYVKTIMIPATQIDNWEEVDSKPAD